MIIKSALVFVAFLYASIAFGQHSMPWNVPEAEKGKKNLYASDVSSIANGRGGDSSLLGGDSRGPGLLCSGRRRLGP